MKIEKNKVVAVSYELEVEGKLADKAGSDKPLEYIHGTHMLIPKFESELEGLEPGAKFAFTVEPEGGYGEYKPEMKVRLPKESFMIDGRVMEELLVPGRVIPMLDSSGGVVQGSVAEVGEDFVVMDFNHPMAGKILNFSGEVLSVREATEKELREGLHGEYLPPEEGCGCHGKGEGCCHGEGKECHGEGEGGHKEGCCHGEGHCRKEASEN